MKTNLDKWMEDAKKIRIDTINSCHNEFVRDIFLSIEDYITRDSITIVSATYYPQFNLFTITGDGLPQARFVFSNDFKEVFFAFAGDWKNNYELQYAANPNSIPHIFPINELVFHLKKIKI